jgi:hypothetical protein
MSRPFWMLALLLSVACSQRTGRPVQLADGGYSLSCKGPLSDCLHHAERLCKDDGYAVVEARDVRERLGHQSGQSTLLIQKSDATIYCGKHAPRAPIELKREPEPEPAPAPAAAPPAPVPPKPAPACVPGSTQACTGPAGCSGGQACNADGTGYDPCNCGS